MEMFRSDFMKCSPSKGRSARNASIAVTVLLVAFVLGFGSAAEPNYELEYQDPAGDVLVYNATWHHIGTVDTQPTIDLKWLKTYNGTSDDVVLRLEVKNNQVLEKTNYTMYVFRIFTKEDNSTGYNVTYRNGTTTIANFNGTIEDDLTANTSIINDNGEVLVVNLSKTDYLDGAAYFNIDAFTWKEVADLKYIDYVSEVPGHPGETGTVIDDPPTNNPDQGLFGIPWWLLLIILLCVIAMVIVIVLKLTDRL
jgi:hypothetical protein